MSRRRSTARKFLHVRNKYVNITIGLASLQLGIGVEKHIYQLSAIRRTRSARRTGFLSFKCDRLFYVCLIFNYFNGTRFTQFSVTLEFAQKRKTNCVSTYEMSIGHQEYFHFVKLLAIAHSQIHISHAMRSVNFALALKVSGSFGLL